MPALKPEIALGAHFKATSTVNTPTSGRIWAGYAPQDTDQPFVIIRRGSTDVDYKMSGPSGLKQVEVDIWITGESYETITDIAEAIEATMHTSVYRGTFTSGAKSIKFDDCTMQDQSDEQEVLDDGEGKPIRRIYQRWRLTYQNG